MIIITEMSSESLENFIVKLMMKWELAIEFEQLSLEIKNYQVRIKRIPSETKQNKFKTLIVSNQ